MKSIKDLSQYERFILDLDGTLLFGDFALEENFFKDVLKENGEFFFQNVMLYLDEYEVTFPRYSIESLSSFLTAKSGLFISPDIISDWIDINCNMQDKIEDTTIEFLENLKKNGKNVAVLTNWFKKTQVSRLANSGLLPYIDEVYAGDEYLKPTPEAYINASFGFGIDKCVMIGDHYEKDFLAPRKVGMHSILYDSKGKVPESDDTIKSLIKLKGRY